MVNIIPPLSVLTPNTAANELQAEGLDALGLTVPTLSPAWADQTPSPADYDAGQMTLTLTRPRAPFRAMLTFEAAPTIWSGVDGAPLTGPIAVLRLHPEAARRLQRLAAQRYGDPLLYPMPVAMVLQGVAPPATPPAVNWFLAGEVLRWNQDGEPGDFGTVSVSFHDDRGLMIDPIAVAAMFADLITGWSALRMTADPTLTEAGDGGLTGIGALASGVRCQVIDPHGWGYQPTRDQARLKVIDGDGNELAIVPDGGSLLDWTAGQQLGRAQGDDPDIETDENSPPPPPRPLHWGWATHGTLEQTALSLPELPEGVTLERRFLRVMAVDLNWHLLGNRSATEVAGIPGDDDTVPDFALPQVRRAVPNFEYLVDGMAVLGAAADIAAGLPEEYTALGFMTSPVIEPSLGVPDDRWPNFPSPNGGQPLPAGVDPTQNLTGQWQTGTDQNVILTLPANAVPDGTHVRIFPRQFVEIRSIGEQPSFVRPNGGAAIAAANTPTRLRLVNPFNLNDDEPRPNPARLEVDIVLTSRTHQRRLFSVIAVTIDNTSEPWDETRLDTFGGQPLLATGAIFNLLNNFSHQSIAPSPLFGIPTSLTPPNNNINTIFDLVRRLGSESQPRQGPRLPTQARFESIFALGIEGENAQMQWHALLTGARWDWESRSAYPELGNPGNPAGPDLHAAGIRCEGQLAYDLAFHALKRAQAIVPVAVNSPGWLVTSGGDNWDAPDPDPSGTVSAAMLETIAPFCDTPELGLPGIPIPGPGDTVQSAVNALTNALATALGVSLDPPTIDVYNEAEIRPRLQREMVNAKFGQREALWALRRAIGQAREFIYIESPTFARTAYPDGSPQPHEIDLVEVIRQRLADNPRLKVMLCLPRLPDFAPERENWVRAAFSHRRTALEPLIAQASDRVAAFHPIGFPGRSAVIRSTVVIVDDIWCSVGTSHLRRRGMTFDGGVDVVSCDRDIVRGYANRIARFRQALMAAKLGVEVPNTPDVVSALWIRLSQPESTFDAIADLLQQGGLGRCSPIWSGPTDTSVIEQALNIADPNGVDSTGAGLLNIFLPLLLED
ncbi:MAG: hypothetical protein F6J95_002700 [Leptolyngbya sp. SIO1E4]|nr:hypothetical protein [Leptolyngbya sp. SIO1E4]